MSNTTDNTPKISISVVSHGQIQLVANLLHDLTQFCHVSTFELILTLNLNEALPFVVADFTFPIKIIRNPKPLGFAANHNQAFTQAAGAFFCVMNPDIRLHDDPFSLLLTCLRDTSVGVVAPLILNEKGVMEDSVRRFPTPLIILCKALGRCKSSDYVVNDQLLFPDWVGGMFMLFSREMFSAINGFDDRYFLYYEDVDLCARLTLRGYKVCLSPKSKVIHQAQRTSHHNPRYLLWHLASMLRFFLSLPFRIIMGGRLAKSIQTHQVFKIL
ncbi:glycosyl transferase [Crenothrix sp. D3]|jgi:GT2 family glycosyltransferase|nr:glycosyl transferase [Crenothrix sp. D3]